MILFTFMIYVRFIIYFTIQCLQKKILVFKRKSQYSPMHNIMIYFSLHQCTISYDLLFLTLEWEVSYIKCQSQIAHSAPKNLCSQTSPFTLSLSQMIELQEEAKDEPKLFTRSQGLIKSNIKKQLFQLVKKSIYKINYSLSVCPFLGGGKCGVCYQIFYQTTQLSTKVFPSQSISILSMPMSYQKLF